MPEEAVIARKRAHLRKQCHGLIDNGDEVVVTHIDSSTNKAKEIKGLIEYRSTFPHGDPVIVYRHHSYNRGGERLNLSKRTVLYLRDIEDIKLVRPYKEVYAEAKKISDRKTDKRNRVALDSIV